MAQPRPRGRPKKLPDDYKQFPLRLPPDLHRQLRIHALDTGKSLNDILLEVIAEWWADRRSRPGRRARTSRRA